ncbi:MAG: TlpA family protein disulfide reductase [Candidatus Krumholzibacteriota bacterium]|nr:TlpA family protein disulfide reductase [Candidatus Krumholzibacteriota bacterium]
MKQITTVFALLLALAAGPAAAADDDAALAPDFTLTTLDGKEAVTLSALRGKVVYLDFWASWCGPCRQSFPEVKKLHAEYGKGDFVVLAVNLDRSTAPALRFMDSQKAEFTAVFDQGGKVAARYGVRGIPTTVLIGADGRIAHQVSGFHPKMMPDLKARIESLLEEAAAAAKRDDPDGQAAGKPGKI